MELKNWNWVGIAFVIAISTANAHLSTSGFKPAGGETFTVGTTTKITWSVINLHDGKMNIDFSKDGGKTWTTVKAYQADAAGEQNFNWTPDVATTQGKIRICQTAGGPACTDAQNTSIPDISAPYILVSPAFTVSGASSVSAPALSGEASLSFNPETRNVNVSFALASEQDVSLQAFDAQGHLVATLLQGSRSAGFHQLSLYSNRLEAVNGVVVLKLRAGAESRTQSWNLAR
jgi:hypothetical protein